MNWRVKLPVTLNEQTRGLAFLRELGKYYMGGRGILTMPAGIIAGFVKTRPELEGPDVQYHFAHASYASAAVRKLDREPGMTIVICQLRPESRGSIHMKSADPLAAPAIRPNFLAEAVDRQCVVDGMKIARRIVEQRAMDRYRAFEMTPAPRSRATRNGSTSPASTARPSITPSAPARWATIRWPSSTTGCACTASAASG